MRAANLSSSLIGRIAHDRETGCLCVTFRHGGTYVYFDVPAAEYEALKTAQSPGRYYNSRIKGRYRCRFDPRRRRFRPGEAA